MNSKRQVSTLEDLEVLADEILKILPTGEENGITINEIANSVNCEQVDTVAAIGQLQRMGRLVVISNDRFFMAKDPEEFFTYVVSYILPELDVIKERFNNMMRTANQRWNIDNPERLAMSCQSEVQKAA